MISRVFDRVYGLPWLKVSEWVVIGFIAVVLLWRGGKGIEATWALTAVTWLAVFAYWARGGSEEERIPIWLWAASMGLALWMVVSAGFSLTKNYGLDEVLRTGALLLLFLWAARRVPQDLGDRISFLRKLLVVLLPITFLACIIGVGVYVGQPVNRFVGTFFYFRFATDYWPNAWAEYLLLVWPLLAAWVLKEKRPWQSVLSMVPLGFVFGCLLLTYSRGAILACAAQLMLWGAITWWKSAVFFPWKMFALRAGTVVVIAVGLFFGANAVRDAFHHPVQSVTDKVLFTAAEGSSSISERRQFWGQALSLANARPWTGWGPYSFRFIQPRLQEGVLATSDHPHNVVLKFAAEEGWIGAILFLVVVLGVLFKAAKCDLSDPWFAVPGLFLIGLVGVLAHNFIDYNLQFLAIAVPFWLVLGLLAGALPWKEPIHLNKKVVRSFEVLFATFLLSIAIIEFPPLVTSAIGRLAEGAGEPERALSWYAASSHERFSRDLHLSRTKILYELERYPEAQKALDDYFRQNAEDARAWRRQGDLARASHDLPRALGAYENAFMLAPFNEVGITASLLQTLSELKMTDDIAQRKDEFLAIFRTFADAIDRNVHYIDLSGNVEDLVRLSTLLADLYPLDAPQISVLAAKADHRAKLERKIFSEQPKGYLW